MPMGEDNSTGDYTAAILIASDRAAAGIRPDGTSGLLKSRLEESGFRVRFCSVLPDDKSAIVELLRRWVLEEKINLILTSGGTGLGQRDVTPEATLEVVERRIPGMEEAMRQQSLKITPNAMLSRAVVGCAARSLIINLPGNPAGAIENFNVIASALHHAIELILGRRPDP